MYMVKYSELGKNMGMSVPKYIGVRDRDNVVDDGSRAGMQFMEELRIPEN